MIKGYKYRIYPNDEQKEFITKTFGCVRKVYNLMLEERIKDYDLYKETGIKTKLSTPAKYKKEYPYLAEVDSQALNYAKLNLNKAYSNLFRRIKNKDSKPGFPKFKSKNNPVQSYTTCNLINSTGHNTISIVDDKHLKLPKFKEPIYIRLSRTFKGIIKSVTISKTPTNKYYASILVDDREKEVIPITIIPEQTLGLDLGLKHYLIDSNGNKIDNPKFLNKSLEKLQVAQKIYSRKNKGSNNKEKQRITVARCHERIRNKRDDFIHKLTHKLAHDNQVTSFAIENLNIKGMVKNRKLSRHISDSAWGPFIRFLEYKCKDLGKNVIKIDRFAPSSKTCNNCGHILDKLSLITRYWDCPECDTHHDRDINAARNIKDFGLAHLVSHTGYVKNSPVTKLLSDSVAAKDI